MLDTASTVVTAPTPVISCRPRRWSSWRTPGSPTPGPTSRCCATSRSPPSRADDGHHRLHRGRQDHPGLAAPAAVRRHRPAGCWSTMWTSGSWSPSCCGAGSDSCRRSRSCSPGRWPATSGTATRTRPTTSCGTPCGWPRRTTSSAQMPGQLDAAIAQGGTNVSGGQRQRLSIARALVKQPEIYIFDDSFSALDVATDARLRAALKRETTDACVIIVGQRVATIAEADKILVLEDGRAGRLRHPRRVARSAARRTPRSSTPSSAPRRRRHE